MKGCCRHCRRSRQYRRGLCWKCYSSPIIRGAYATLYKQDQERPAPLPLEATAAIPGTEEKILVLIERESRTEALHHPGDRNVFPFGAGTNAQCRMPNAQPLAFAPGPPPAADDGLEAGRNG